MPSRRRVLAALGAAAVAGCASRRDGPGSGGDTPTATPTPDAPEDAERHVYGSDGEWSSFGFDAANTRWDRAGTAPTDGVRVRWRVPVAGSLRRTEPLATDGAVYHLHGDRLRSFDADTGETLWTATTEGVARRPPLVRNGVLYLADGDRLRALDAATGDRRWVREFDGRDALTQPATHHGEQLVVGHGETLHALDPDGGATRWRREAFGRVNGLAMAGGFPVVTTEAGLVYWLLDDGSGIWRRQLPGRVTAPPTAGDDYVYVPCSDGRLYAYDAMDEGDGSRVWLADLDGVVDAGVAHAGGAVLAAAGRRLRVLDEETGERRWEFDLGEWVPGAPAVAGETIYVGGDRLHAVKLDGGPHAFGINLAPERFTRSFHGAVGPGPTLDDGRIYVHARTGPDAVELLGLEAG